MSVGIQTRNGSRTITPVYNCLNNLVQSNAELKESVG